MGCGTILAGIEARMKLKKHIIFVLTAAVLIVVTSTLCQSAYGGRIVAWGDNTYGQCDGPSGGEFTAVTGGSWHLALRSNGTLAAWGIIHTVSATCLPVTILLPLHVADITVLLLGLTVR